MTFSRMITDVEQSADSKYQVEVSYDAAHPDVVDFHMVCRRCNFEWNIILSTRSYLETVKEMHDKQFHPPKSALEAECMKALSAARAFDTAEALLIEDEERFLEERKKVLADLEKEPDPMAKADAIALAAKLSYEMMPAPKSPLEKWATCPVIPNNEIAANQTYFPNDITIIPEEYWEEFGKDVDAGKVKLVPPDEEMPSEEDEPEIKISTKVRPVKTDRKRRVLG